MFSLNYYQFGFWGENKDATVAVYAMQSLEIENNKIVKSDPGSEYESEKSLANLRRADNEVTFSVVSKRGD